MPSDILLIGIGNIYRNDDGIGVLIAQKLIEKNLSGVKIIEQSGEGVSLMDSWEGYDRVFIFDAVSSGSKAGTIYFLNPTSEEIPKKFFNYSTHAFSLAESIELARVLGSLPKELFVYGIEGKDFSGGQNITPEVSESAEKIIKEVINKIIKGDKSA